MSGFSRLFEANKQLLGDATAVDAVAYALSLLSHDILLERGFVCYRDDDTTGGTKGEINELVLKGSDGLIPDRHYYRSCCFMKLILKQKRESNMLFLYLQRDGDECGYLETFDRLDHSLLTGDFSSLLKAFNIESRIAVCQKVKALIDRACTQPVIADIQSPGVPAKRIRLSIEKVVRPNIVCICNTPKSTAAEKSFVDLPVSVLLRILDEVLAAAVPVDDEGRVSPKDVGKVFGTLRATSRAWLYVVDLKLDVLTPTFCLDEASVSQMISLIGMLRQVVRIQCLDLRLLINAPDWVEVDGHWIRSKFARIISLLIQRGIKVEKVVLGSVKFSGSAECSCIGVLDYCEAFGCRAVVDQVKLVIDHDEEETPDFLDENCEKEQLELFRRAISHRRVFNARIALEYGFGCSEEMWKGVLTLLWQEDVHVDEWRICCLFIADTEFPPSQMIQYFRNYSPKIVHMEFAPFDLLLQFLQIIEEAGVSQIERIHLPELDIEEDIRDFSDLLRLALKLGKVVWLDSDILTDQYEQILSVLLEDDVKALPGRVVFDRADWSLLRRRKAILPMVKRIEVLNYDDCRACITESGVEVGQYAHEDAAI